MCRHPLVRRVQFTRGANILCHSAGLISDAVLYPCNTCPECMANLRRTWRLRVGLESDSAEQEGFVPYFVTLTVAPAYYEQSDSASPSVEINPHHFWRSFTQRYRRLTGSSFRYFVIPEYGVDPDRTMRLHYHGIIFDMFRADESGKPLLSAASATTMLLSLWQYGGVEISRFSPEHSANYVTKYLLKQKAEASAQVPAWSPRIFVSPGLGLRSFLKDHALTLSPDGTFIYKHKRVSIPPYLVQKLPLSMQISILLHRRGSQRAEVDGQLYTPFEVLERRHDFRFAKFFDYRRSSTAWLRRSYRALLHDVHCEHDALKSYALCSRSILDKISQIKLLEHSYPWLLPAQLRPRSTGALIRLSSTEFSQLIRASSRLCTPWRPAPETLLELLRQSQSTLSPQSRRRILDFARNFVSSGPTSGPTSPNSPPIS